MKTNPSIFSSLAQPAARAGLAIMLLVWLTGCVVPVPSFSGKTEQGREITARQVKFIVPGHTTRAEVVARLGADFRSSGRVSALAYSWQYPGAKLLWWYVVPVPFGCADGGVEDMTGWRAYFVAFDRDGRVVQSEFRRLNQLGVQQSLDEQLETWARHHGAAETTAGAIK